MKARAMAINQTAPYILKAVSAQAAAALNRITTRWTSAASTTLMPASAPKR